ncbi:lipid II flippase MurJ [Streptomyces tanashiensis]
MITGALGAALLGDTFTIAYTLPTMIYILTVGGGLNSVFVPQLVRSMKNDEDGGEAYANRLLTLVMVAARPHHGPRDVRGATADSPDVEHHCQRCRCQRASP